MSVPTPISSRNPWPYAIAGFFAVLIAAIISFVVFATRNKMELVTVDYYEEDVRYQAQLDRVSRTRALGGQVSVRYDAAHEQFVIALPAAHAGGVSGRIQLYRPSNSRMDRIVPFAIDSNGVQRIDTRALAPGLWKVRVLWNAAGEEYFMDQALLVGGGRS